MKKQLLLLSILSTWLVLAILSGCTEVEDLQPKGSFESTTGDLPLFDVKLDSSGFQTIRFDSIAQGGNFSLEFTPLRFGKVKIVEAGKAVQIQMPGGNWLKDSTRYTICKNEVCRKGFIFLENRNYRKPDTLPEPFDTTCSELPLRVVYTPFSTQVVIKNLFPSGFSGKIDSLKTSTYTAIRQGDTAVFFQAGGVIVEEQWAWDTIRYQLKGTNRKCWTGKIAVVLGDSCEKAINDLFLIPGGTGLWPETALMDNDGLCNKPFSNFQTRTQIPFDYGGFAEKPTASGILRDTLVNGNQYYKYIRTNPLATEDGFFYYLKNLTSNRVTKAWVRIRF